MAILNTDPSLLNDTEAPQKTPTATATAPAPSLHPNHPDHPDRRASTDQNPVNTQTPPQNQRANIQQQGQAVNDQSNHNTRGSTATGNKSDFVPPAVQHHVYGKVQAFEIRTTTNKRNIPTVAFDFAKKIPNKDAFDWKNNLIFQLTPSELFEFCALMLGIKAEAKWKFHDGKSMHVQWKEDGNIIFSCMKEERRFSVAVIAISDRVNVMNAGLYALAAGQKISITEARLQISALCKMINPVNQQPLMPSAHREQ